MPYILILQIVVSLDTCITLYQNKFLVFFTFPHSRITMVSLAEIPLTRLSFLLQAVLPPIRDSTDGQHRQKWKTGFIGCIRMLSTDVIRRL